MFSHPCQLISPLLIVRDGGMQKKVAPPVDIRQTPCVKGFSDGLHQNPCTAIFFCACMKHMKSLLSQAFSIMQELYKRSKALPGSIKALFRS